MFNLNLDTKEDLQNIIDIKLVENLQIEFKKYIFIDGKVGSKEKDDLLKEITAFANAEGGYIIIGIDEDGQGMASKIQHTQSDITQFDGIQLSIQQYMLAKVRPRLYGVSMKAIIIENDKIAITINIPKSFNKPHAVNDGNKDNFYIRHSNGITYMSVDDLRNQFIMSTSFKFNIKQFRSDRIGMILANECVANLSDGAKLLIHIIPLWSLDSGNSIDIKQLYYSPFIDNTIPISGGGWIYRFNSDGFCVMNVNNPINTYSQIFKNGIIESLDIKMMNNKNEKNVCNWIRIENTIYDTLKRYTTLLIQLNIPKPWYIYISFLNAKGVKSYNFYELSECIDRDIVNATECIWIVDEQTLDSVIKVTFDSLANAFGMPESPSFNKDGNYIKN